MIGFNEFIRKYGNIDECVQDKDNSLQKKSFKVLQAMCEHSGEFVKEHLEDIKKVIFNTLETCNSSAKKVCRLIDEIEIMTCL
jgi:hypothetical protein